MEKNSILDLAITLKSELLRSPRKMLGMANADPENKRKEARESPEKTEKERKEKKLKSKLPSRHPSNLLEKRKQPLLREKAEEEEEERVKNDLFNLNHLYAALLLTIGFIEYNHSKLYLKRMSYENEPKTVEDYKDVVKILKLKIIKQNKKIQ